MRTAGSDGYHCSLNCSPHLEEAFDRAQPGALNLITRYRDTNANLRTQFGRILRRAGVKQWPRLFQILRASRETELAERFPLHVVAEWVGNSPKTALAHYTQVTEEHYRLAANQVAQNPAQFGAESTRKVSQGIGGETTVGDVVQQLASGRDTTQNYLVTPTGFEPVSRP